jgi:hypothetical protein
VARAAPPAIPPARPEWLKVNSLGVNGVAGRDSSQTARSTANGMLLGRARQVS